MRKTYITAIVIAAATVLWLASGQFGDHTDEATQLSISERNERVAASAEDRPPSRVRARVSTAVQQTAYASVRGRTENKRTVQVRAETVGRVVARPVERGDRAATGDALCRLSRDDRDARLAEAQAALRQAYIEYRGSQQLKTQGFQSETAIATAAARLAATRARLRSIELDIERTLVRAPFDGMVEVTHVEIGDYVQPGMGCVTLVDLDPMLLVGQIAEKDVLRVGVGEQAFGELATGQRLAGAISFIAQQADATTRTYRVEVEVPNADYALRSGITADILIAAESVPAHHVSPALFALDDAGAVGLRTLDTDNVVRFHRLDILRDDKTGVWITGLPKVATLITVGHEFVVPGEQVDADFEPSREPPAPSAPGVPAMARMPVAGPALTAPDDASPSLAITVRQEGISPQESDRLLVTPLETELRSVDGVTEIDSFAYEGVAAVHVRFGADHDFDTVARHVRDAVERVRPELPATAEAPVIAEHDPDDFPGLRLDAGTDAVPAHEFEPGAESPAAVPATAGPGLGGEGAIADAPPLHAS